MNRLVCRRKADLIVLLLLSRNKKLEITPIAWCLFGCNSVACGVLRLFVVRVFFAIFRNWIPRINSIKQYNTYTLEYQ